MKKKKAKMSEKRARSKARNEIIKSRSHKMDRYDYVQYLHSEHWKKTKAKAIKRAGCKCEKCGKQGVVLEVHHLRYDNLHQEKETDLLVLCSRCHGEIHRQGGYI